MKKALVLYVIVISCAVMLTLGCAGRSNNSPTAQIPSATPGASAVPVTVTPSPMAGINDSSAGSITATPIPTMADDSNVSVFDDSLVNISGEDNESMVEDDIPTPDAG